jgi:hypothetical protein
MPADSRPHHLITERKFNRHLVPTVGKPGVYPLGQAVVRARQKQDLHLAPRPP